MDVPAILTDACERARMPPSELARRAGTSSGAISQLLRGRVSPTVRTLDRLLAAAGLQLRVELEPLLADLDARVDAVLGDVGPLPVEPLQRVAQALDSEQTWVVDGEPGGDVRRCRGPVTWAFDGETALRAHGLGFPAQVVEVAVQFDEAARAFFFRGLVRGTGGPPVSWFAADLMAAQQHLGSLALGPFGMVRFRLLTSIQDRVRVEVAPGFVVPVLALADVEAGRPDLGEVLARLRERREGQART